MKVKPQVTGIVAIIAIISGYLIISDWQAIPFDPCTNCSPYHHPNLLKNISACENSFHNDSFKELNSMLDTNSYLRSKQRSTLESNLYLAEPSNTLVLYDDDYSIVANKCMSISLPHHTCHWIPFSLIAHKDCEDCPPICRSIEQTLSFPQFMIGMALLVATNPLVWFPMIAFISNQAPLEMQVRNIRMHVCVDIY